MPIKMPRFLRPSSRNPENDPFSERDKAELSALMQEWAGIRAEAVSRINAQMLIVAANIAITGALASAALGLSQHQVPLLLALPFLSSAAVGLFYSQDGNLIALAQYSDAVLRPRVQALLRGPDESPLLSWEQELHAFRTGKDNRPLWRFGASASVLMIMPSLIVLAGTFMAWLAYPDFHRTVHQGEKWLWVGGVAATVAVASVGSRAVARAYLRIGHSASTATASHNVR